MAQTKDGAVKSAAKKAQMSLADFINKINQGFKRCTTCGEWREKINFGKDRTRFDGLDSHCFFCRRVKERKSTKGRKSKMKGKKFPKHIAKTMGRKPGFKSEKKGVPRTLEERVKISAAVRLVAVRGAACPSFKDGKFAERMGQRYSAEYQRWRFDVYSRDKFACQDCRDEKGHNLNAHHVKHFADHPELRFEVSNGITLCKPCHKKRHKSI